MAWALLFLIVTSFLAFDLGAESGRAVLGTLDGERLAVNETARFANTPIREGASLRWDVHALRHEVSRALTALGNAPIESLGVDTWGCDYGLIGSNGELLELPYHYRDTRTDGVMARVFARVPRERIYAITGVQCLPFNTLYQLCAARAATPDLVESARMMLTMPDLVNFWMTGRLACEYTNATTTQCVDVTTRRWAVDLLSTLDLPTHIFGPIVEPGTRLGSLRGAVSAAYAGTPVVAPACHDTGSAVASVAASGHTAFLSSGTWSLLGTEVPQPIVSARGRELNFTNEGGVGGTTRLLKNIGGLWLLQSCRRAWADEGHAYSYEELVVSAGDNRRAFRTLVDPDDPAFLHPEKMTTAIADYCRATGQPAPDEPGDYARTIFESLAFKYRVVLEWLEEVTGTPIHVIRVIGGGARNRLLNQFTADATGRVVLAGPVEATALGNIAMQMIATGAVATLAEAREIIERSFPSDRFEPTSVDVWAAHYARFQEYVGLTCA